MLKKFRSKRGFTLVEVMVAFVIFAIMAAMVGVIVNSAMLAKQQNREIEDEITRQQQELYLKEQKVNEQAYKDNQAAGNPTGVLSLDLNKNTNTGTTVVGNVTMDYVAADPTGTDDNLELQYYIGKKGNDLWQSPVTDPSKPGSTPNDSVLGGLDCGIYGTNGIDNITVGIEPVVVDSKTRYYLYLFVKSAPNCIEFQKNFAQLRVKFPSEVSKIGYLNNKGDDLEYSWDIISYSAVDITIPGDKSTLRISGDGQGRSIYSVSVDNPIPICWIELSEALSADQLADMNQIFGDSGSTETGTVEITGLKTGAPVSCQTYYRYTVDDDPNTTDDDSITYVNVFAAKQKPIDDKPEEGESE